MVSTSTLGQNQSAVTNSPRHNLTAVTARDPNMVRVNTRRQTLERQNSRQTAAMPQPEARRKVARRPHIKSRSGCKNCKRRKVKCGEEYPSCRNCTKRGIKCDLVALLKGSGNNDGLSLEHLAHFLHGDMTQPLLRPLSGTSHGMMSTGLTILDLELLHHYSIFTCYTLSSDPPVRNFFRIDAPQLGFKHHYVLYSILSLAAQHLAHFRPELRAYYTAEATSRHTMATSMAAPLLSGGVTAETAVPMYCFSTLTLWIAFASLREADDLFFDADNILPNWFDLFRGLRTILESNGRAIYQSSIRFLFQSPNDVDGSWDTNTFDHEALNELHEYICSTSPITRHNNNSNDSLSNSNPTSYVNSTTNSPSLNNLGPFPSPSHQALIAASTDLRSAFSFFYSSPSSSIPSHNETKSRAIFTWLYKLSDPYIALLREKDSKALLILGFFCVLLHKLDHNWWLKGWGLHLIDRIYGAIDDGHRYWLGWAIREIGWVPRRSFGA